MLSTRLVINWAELILSYFRYFQTVFWPKECPKCIILYLICKKIKSFTEKIFGREPFISNLVLMKTISKSWGMIRYRDTSTTISGLHNSQLTLVYTANNNESVRPPRDMAEWLTNVIRTASVRWVYTVWVIHCLFIQKRLHISHMLVLEALQDVKKEWCCAHWEGMSRGIHQ